MPRRVDDFRGLTQHSRVRLLHAVQRNPGRQLKELAEEAGLRLSTTRDHLTVLEEEGLIVVEPLPTGSRGRPPMGFSPVRAVEESEPARRRVTEARRRGEQLRRLNPELHPSGHSGPALEESALHQLDTLYEHLDDAGLEPEMDEAELTVGLIPCLYEDMIDVERPAVCAMHATLVRDQLEQAGGPVRLRRLRPFVGPRRCELILGLINEAESVECTDPGSGNSDGSDSLHGIDSDRSDAELESYALAARRAAASSV
ncbi:MAG: winged helix-turn-helix transcriptional regulator [Micrococcaceae bacterium]